MSGMLRALQYTHRKLPVSFQKGFVEAHNKGYNEVSKINTGTVSRGKGKGKRGNTRLGSTDTWNLWVAPNFAVSSLAAWRGKKENENTT